MKCRSYFEHRQMAEADIFCRCLSALGNCFYTISAEGSEKPSIQNTRSTKWPVHDQHFCFILNVISLILTLFYPLLPPCNMHWKTSLMLDKKDGRWILNYAQLRMLPVIYSELCRTVYFKRQHKQLCTSTSMVYTPQGHIYIFLWMSESWTLWT